MENGQSYREWASEISARIAALPPEKQRLAVRLIECVLTSLHDSPEKQRLAVRLIECVVTSLHDSDKENGTD